MVHIRVHSAVHSAVHIAVHIAMHSTPYVAHGAPLGECHTTVHGAALSALHRAGGDRRVLSKVVRRGGHRLRLRRRQIPPLARRAHGSLLATRPICICTTQVLHSALCVHCIYCIPSTHTQHMHGICTAHASHMHGNTAVAPWTWHMHCICTVVARCAGGVCTVLARCMIQ